MARSVRRGMTDTLALGAAGLAALVLGALSPARAQVEHATIALPAPVVVFNALYVAQDYFWPKEGLDVKFINIAGIGAMNAVISGSAEFSVASSGSITRAAAHGQRLLAIANLQTDNGQLVVLRKDIADAGHFDPKASFAARGQFLKGRTLSTGSYGAVSDVVMRLQAKAAGLDSEKDMTITQMQPADALAAMSRHAIDGFSYAPPWGYIAVQAGTAVVLLDGSNGDPPGYSPLASSLLVARPQLCTERRALCEKMGHSMVEATKFLKRASAASDGGAQEAISDPR